MAHNIRIPAALEFRIPKVEWTVRKASGKLCFSPYPADRPVKLSLLEPAELIGLFDMVPISALPVEQQRKLPSHDELKHMLKENCPVPQLIGKDAVEVLHCRVSGSAMTWPQGEYRPIDPWRMRDEFLSLKRSTEELVKFLNKHGNWSRRTHPRKRLSPSGEWRAAIVLPNEIWADRDSIIEDLRAGPKSWLEKGRGRSQMFYTREIFPYLAHLDSYCMDALESALMVDFLRGKKFRTCSRKDCAIPFEIHSKHKRRYCTQYCAHLESVRRNRRKRAKGKSGKVK